MLKFPIPFVAHRNCKLILLQSAEIAVRHSTAGRNSLLHTCLIRQADESFVWKEAVFYSFISAPFCCPSKADSTSASPLSQRYRWMRTPGPSGFNCFNVTYLCQPVYRFSYLLHMLDFTEAGRIRHRRRESPTGNLPGITKLSHHEGYNFMKKYELNRKGKALHLPIHQQLHNDIIGKWNIFKSSHVR